jgi:hypothetical protein
LLMSAIVCHVYLVSGILPSIVSCFWVFLVKVYFCFV